MNKLHIIFCKGMQASGKSTWAKQFVKDNQNYKRVCRDDIRHMVSSYTFDNENEKLVSSIEESVIMSTIFKKYNLIVDKMNLNNKQLNLDIATIKAHAKDIGYKEEDIEIEIKEFPITIGEAIERDSKRDFPFGKSVLKSTWGKYEQILQEMIDKSKLKFQFKEELPKAYIFDIDGSVAIKYPGRNIYDGSKCYLDLPIIPVLNVAKSLYQNGYKIIFLSGRDSKYFEVTSEWLLKHYNKDISSFTLFMRKEGDNRQDAIVKKEIFLNNIADNFEVIGIFDDRPQVLRLWQNEIGIWTFALNQDVDCKNDF